jgi:hypothetical protein
VASQLRSQVTAGTRVGLAAGRLRRVIDVLAEHGEAESRPARDEALTQAPVTMKR